VERAHGLQGGDRIEVTMERSMEGKNWTVRHAQSGLSRTIENWREVPVDQQPGTVTVILKSISAQNTLIVLWPTPEKEARYTPKSPEKRGPGKGARPGRR
jgi:hypothetical protein